MRSAVIDATGVVVNVIVADSAEDFSGCKLVESAVANIGDTFVDGVFKPKSEPVKGGIPLNELWAAK